MDIDEILNSGAFYILCLVGYGAFAIMIIVLKGMKQADIMPWWVKILVIIVVPIVAAFFSSYAEG